MPREGHWSTHASHNKFNYIITPYTCARGNLSVVCRHKNRQIWVPGIYVFCNYHKLADISKKTGFCALRVAEYGSLVLQIVHFPFSMHVFYQLHPLHVLTLIQLRMFDLDAGKGCQIMKCIQVYLCMSWSASMLYYATITMTEERKGYICALKSSSLNNPSGWEVVMVFQIIILMKESLRLP